MSPYRIGNIYLNYLVSLHRHLLSTAHIFAIGLKSGFYEIHSQKFHSYLKLLCLKCLYVLDKKLSKRSLKFFSFKTQEATKSSLMTSYIFITILRLTFYKGAIHSTSVIQIFPTSPGRTWYIFNPLLKVKWQNVNSNHDLRQPSLTLDYLLKSHDRFAFSVTLKDTMCAPSEKCTDSDLSNVCLGSVIDCKWKSWAFIWLSGGAASFSSSITF